MIAFDGLHLVLSKSDREVSLIALQLERLMSKRKEMALFQTMTAWFVPSPLIQSGSRVRRYPKTTQSCYAKHPT